MSRPRAFLFILVTVVVLGSTIAAAKAATSMRSQQADLALTCADETSPSTPPRIGQHSPLINLGGIALDNLKSREGTAGLHGAIKLVAGGRTYWLLKAFAYVLRPAGKTIHLSVESPSTTRLYYAAYTYWAKNPSDESIVAHAKRAATFSSCAGPTGYMGALLVTRAACVTLKATAVGLRPRQVAVPVGVSRCKS